MTSGKLSLEFIWTLCKARDINANWLLYGLGPMHKRDLTAEVVISFKPESVRDLAGAAGQALAEGIVLGERRAATPNPRAAVQTRARFQ